ncbi:PEP-CTERM sorting domain-containing protein [Aliiglaciecola sp. CAU 1673]|uniref:PEP-CTERM sorting domain-containing protein n=1 Tax=Aliiglaciecola sp. CAU 1673 TaxID=3032595 RepID=UPI0023DC21D2|nr:PEP-CTERM sorting domain-containing protein [Aliiglaciecola sp. CAU 1673]MDF2177321.1 PEP-CTERM sorting domain-containing protein [Aliiglaciecola sp. CAU 1673]
MNVKNKILGAGLLLAMSSPAALADEFYIDVGADFGDNGFAQAAGNTTTGWLQELLYEYSSNTVVTDTDLNGIDAGDTIVTTGGFIDGDVTSLSTNKVTGFSPQQNVLDPLSPSENGYGAWGLTFQFELFGAMLGGLGDGLPVSFNSGSVTFYYFDATTPTTAQFIELFTINVISTLNSFGGPSITGEIASYGGGSVNGVNAGDVFNFADGSFADYVDMMVQIVADIDFNTDPNDVTITDNMDGTFTLTGEHDGSISFAVPEPSSLAIIGLGLLGLAGAARRRKA